MCNELKMLSMSMILMSDGATKTMSSTHRKQNSNSTGNCLITILPGLVIQYQQS